MDAARQPEPVARPVEVSISKLATTVFSVIALMLAFAALAVSAGNDGDAKAAVQGGVVAGAVPISLVDIALDPRVAEAEVDGVLQVTNKGAAPHTLAIEGEDLATEPLNPAGSAQLSLKGLEPGTILVGDLPLPGGVAVSQEIPMMLNDAGTIGFSLNGKSFPATAPIAVKPGEWFIVHYLNEGVMAHPMHLHGMEQLVIAKDGLPVAQPYAADTINVSPGERYSVLVHADEPGVWAWHCHILPHAEREDGMFGMVTALVVQ